MKYIVAIWVIIAVKINYVSLCNTKIYLKYKTIAIIERSLNLLYLQHYIGSHSTSKCASYLIPLYIHLSDIRNANPLWCKWHKWKIIGHSPHLQLEIKNWIYPRTYDARMYTYNGRNIDYCKHTFYLPHHFITVTFLSV